MTFDDLGRGEDEGKRNFEEVPASAWLAPLEVLKQVASTGYLRKRMPQELVVLQGGAGAIALARPPPIRAALKTLVPEIGVDGQRWRRHSISMDARAKAKMQGYEGDPCGDCGNYTLVRNGTCMKCNTCGGTSGCS